MQNLIKSMIDESIETKKLVQGLSPQIEKSVHLIINALRNNKKILIAGNGGSASQASHIAAEFLGRYKKERKGLPCINLTAENSFMTAWSNDYSYDTVFERQLQALAHLGDVFIAISTSGNSTNIIKAVEAAKNLNLHVIGFLGKKGGKLKGSCDIEIIIPSDNTPVIQENHLMIMHIICELVDKELFG